jgi:hypothetical protein
MRGQGYATACKVRATKIISGSDGSAVQYLDFSIEKISTELPDGSYELLVNDGVIPVERQNGSWLSL